MIFCHTLLSDWNHGHAHFLRGIVTDLMVAGHRVDVYEPRDAWSLRNLLGEEGGAALLSFHRAYPHLWTNRYDLDTLDLDRVLRGADIVVVQEWNDPELVARVAAHHRTHRSYRLYWHDAHHRSVTAPRDIGRLALDGFDATLGFSPRVAETYLAEGWTARAEVWHEAADVRVFRPRAVPAQEGDLVWVGNWGDEERSQAIRRFLVGPVETAGLRATVHGVRYPRTARRTLHEAGIRFAGWVANPEVPGRFARHRLTVHIPRGPYVDAIPGTPTIRVFEALACGVPLVTSPWTPDGMFTPGHDLLMADDEANMAGHFSRLMRDKYLRRDLGHRGRASVLRRHTTWHRVRDLLAIDRRLRGRRTGRRFVVHTSAALTITTRPAVRTAAAHRAGDGPLLHRDGTIDMRNGNGHAKQDGQAPGPLVQVEARRRLDGPHIAFFGSSITSSYWNGAATYYRGLFAELAKAGCRVTFFEPDIELRRAHRDFSPPDRVEVVRWEDSRSGADRALAKATGADIVVKASGVGAQDRYLERQVLTLQGKDTAVLFWDVDAPATLERLENEPSDPYRALIPKYDGIMTYGGGPPVVSAYASLGARFCVPVYNGIDPSTHHPVAPEEALRSEVSLLANRLPDREARVQEYFFRPALRRPDDRFILGGSGWDRYPFPENVDWIGHVPMQRHNVFNCSARVVLNVTRSSMARFGYAPATRVFEVAGAGACLVSDAWQGFEEFFEPGREIVLVRSGNEVDGALDRLDPETAAKIGARARERVLRDHTYERRAAEVMKVLGRLEVAA